MTESTPHLTAIAAGDVDDVFRSRHDGKTWALASLGEDHGPYAFRMWQYTWTPRAPGQYLLAVRATDAKGHVQPDEGVWNPGGYLWNTVERQEVIVGAAS